MHFTDLASRFPAILDSGISVELLSAPGRGKSEFVKQTVSRMGERDGKPWGFATMFLATMTPSDLLGYMVPTKAADGAMSSVFTRPAWMTTVDGKDVREYERGILFLDEFGQGEADVKRASAELLLNRQLGPHRLPDGWSVIAASNRASDRSGVTKSFDFVINRRLQIEISDDLNSWEAWAIDNNVDPLFVAFAVQNPHIVFSDGVPEKQGPWCTPRSLVMTSQVLAHLTPEGKQLPTDASAVEIAAGLIGEGAAAQLFAFVRLGQEMPKFEDIVKDPKKVRVSDKPDANMLICYQLAARIDISTAEPVIEYVERLPKEFAVTFAKTACRRDPKLIGTKAFGNWCRTNASLVTLLADAA